MRLVLFDCDGTLADSFGIICATMARTFERSNLTVPAETEIHGVIGLSLDLAIARLAPDLDEGQVGALAELYRQTFHEMRTIKASEERLFPGIEALLRRLGAREDLLIGMVTGKSRRGVRAILQAHSLESLFVTVRTADDCPSKPHPAMVLECCAETGVPPVETLVVGDAVFDMAMARNAGAGGLGVSWGAGSKEALVEAGAGAVFDDAESLGRALEGWLAVPIDDAARAEVREFAS